MPTTPSTPSTPSTAGTEADRAAVLDVVTQFFDAFSSAPGVAGRMAALRELLLTEAVIVRTCGDLVAYGVGSFIAPREQLLSGGTVADFREWQLDGRLDLFGDIAQWFGSYAKSWRQDGQEQTGRGMKSIQLVRTERGWRISAVIWDDERV